MTSRPHDRNLYVTAEERATFDEWLKDYKTKRDDEVHRTKTDDLNDYRRRTGFERFATDREATSTNTGVYGRKTNDDINSWLSGTADSRRHEDANTKKTRFAQDDRTTLKGTYALTSTTGSDHRMSGSKESVHTRTGNPTYYLTGGHTNSSYFDRNNQWQQDGNYRRGDHSPTRESVGPRTGHREPKPVDYGHSTHASYDHHDETYNYNKYSDQRFQQQETMQQQRSIQASMQMAYTVFGNVITALETYEEREARKYGYRAPRKSRIPIPDQDFKNDEDVKASLMSQLKVFETHLKVCPKQVRDDVTSDMKVMVAEWLSARDDPRRFSTTKTDEYAARLFEILVKGSTTHVDFSRQQKVMGKTELMGNFQKVVRGQALADDLDRSFRDDPRKTATRPDVRRGTDINKGLRRIDVCNASLSPYTRELKEPSTSIR